MQPSYVFPTFLSTKGNKETLVSLPSSRGQDVRKELLEFHSKYYSSNVMALAVLGKGEIYGTLVNDNWVEICIVIQLTCNWPLV